MGNDRKITNTSAMPPGLEMLFPGSIEAQERQGQAELAGQTSRLPTDGSENLAWAKMGVTFGPADPSDPIFRPATLPTGWKIERTDHAMWSKLVDDKGRPRASIFYKAAFYDRSAHVRIDRRFSVTHDYSSEHLLRAQVLDGEAPVFSTGAIKKPGDFQARIDAQDKQEAECMAWLAENYPGWEDPTAHWND